VILEPFAFRSRPVLVDGGVGVFLVAVGVPTHEPAVDGRAGWIWPRSCSLRSAHNDAAADQPLTEVVTRSQVNVNAGTTGTA